ncbi:uncharacterized protein YbjT (DUF2867 family) [Paenibacillus shirakamiensis]|uniref:Uncharacterized protein YbjT (DUF2867 family) n=1 Tax=Paenibacillus shirakamiensis TaxID=1265935 RepID=A0ABS4JMP0_9BACL|nr:SDR family oxidoreductase [Paenibacillus shirakamiensis]MBP2001869.1 uncharacterized protein YbjT (DUF2867 family) [Paenibacillus shirakamiensis]
MDIVFVAGAHGGTGQRIVRELLHCGYKVHGLVRNQEQADVLEAMGARAFVGDLTGSFSAGLKEADAVICAVGAGMKGRPEEVDHLGTVRLIEQSVIDGVERFVLISSIGTLYPEHMPDMLKPFLLAKRQAEKVLEESTLVHTIIRPGGLTNEEGTGRIHATVEPGLNGIISRDDVARAAVLSLTQSKTDDAAFDLVGGDTPVAEALAELKV